MIAAESFTSDSGYLFGPGLDPWAFVCERSGTITKPRRAMWYERLGIMHIRFICPNCGAPHDHDVAEIVKRMEAMWEWERI